MHSADQFVLMHVQTWYMCGKDVVTTCQERNSSFHRTKLLQHKQQHAMLAKATTQKAQMLVRHLPTADAAMHTHNEKPQEKQHIERRELCKCVQPPWVAQTTWRLHVAVAVTHAIKPPRHSKQQ
jgi:hypothetical protein